MTFCSSSNVFEFVVSLEYVNKPTTILKTYIKLRLEIIPHPIFKHLCVLNIY